MANLRDVKDRTWNLFLASAPQPPGRETERRGLTAAEPRRRFSVFDPAQLERGTAVAEAHLAAADAAGGAADVAAAVTAVLDRHEALQGVEDPELLDFALGVFISHHPAGRALSRSVPNLAQRHPALATPSRVVEEEEDRRDGRRLTSPEVSGGVLPQPDGLEWFREDPFANDHHYHWHVVFPGGGIGGRPKDRQGELFWYMHQQMLARYDAERRAVGLPRVTPFDDYREPWDDGYDPGPALRAEGFGTRFEGDRQLDVPGSSTVAGQITLKGRLDTAVTSGQFATLPPRQVTPNRLGATLEANVGSVSRTIYGSLHNAGHMHISEACDGGFGVIGSTTTAIRDPVFWRWHKHIDDFGADWQATQTPNDFAADRPPVALRKSYDPDTDTAASPDLLLVFENSLSEEQLADLDGWAALTYGPAAWDHEEGTSPELTTRMETRLLGLADGTAVPLEHLVHRPFLYVFRLENRAERALSLTLRVFLVPKQDAEDRRGWIEMDKFLVALGPGERRAVPRQGALSAVIKKPGEMLPPLLAPGERSPNRPIPDDGDDTTPETDCTCGWPYNLLVPRGTPEGMPFRLFVMATDASLDLTPGDSTCGSLSFCGAVDRYPDRREMGYPFDRPFEGSIADTVMTNSHMAFRDLTVRRLADIDEEDPNGPDDPDTEPEG